MKILKTLRRLFSKGKVDPLPLLIIRKNAADANVKEYKSIEEAIEDLEKDPNVSKYKIEKLKSSLKDLQNKSSIRISNGELVK